MGLGGWIGDEAFDTPKLSAKVKTLRARKKLSTLLAFLESFTDIMAPRPG